MGEFGQIRESYRRLKNLHFFVKMFAERLCSLQTVLPDGASEIEPKDKETLRYAVRTDGKRGFLFVNNYQDHAQMEDKRDACVVLQLKNETITFQFDLAKEGNVIKPFHFDMEGIDLVKVTAQPITRIEDNGKFTYVFFTPAGMKAVFEFEEGVLINGDKQNLYTCRAENIVMTYPKDMLGKSTAVCEVPELNELFGIYKFNTDEKKIPGKLG